MKAKNKHGRTPLHEAAGGDRFRPYISHLNIAQLLIEKGADIDTKDKEGRTPLAAALEKDKKDMADLLGKHGAKE